VVASTLALARELGTLTTAEGVETEAQFDYMREAGVDLVQGYLFGRPVPVAQLEFNNVTKPNALVA
jgi:EAL domain-containing protein (putative c-di-GMP-specific phosphodiesterase class I)